MKAGRDILLIGAAVLIDALQAVLGWMAFAVGLGLQAITPAGGAVGGAAAGAYVCWNSTGGTVSALIAAGKCALAGGAAGALASTFGIPLGTALGFVLEIIVSLTFGAGLIFLLIINGMYYSTRTPIGLIAELIPGLDILPGWTVMTILCVLKKRSEQGEKDILTTGVRLASAAAAVSFANPILAARSVQSIRNTRNTMRSDMRPSNGTQQREPLNLKSPRMADVIPRQPLRAANDNQPYVQKAA